MRRLIFLVLILTSLPATAGKVEVLGVRISPEGERTYRFDVTLRHTDQGWDHYANKWTVSTTDGKVLGERILLHPHVHEQPFTRSLDGVNIPADIRSVNIQAFDSVHGASDLYPVKLPRD